ncbi:MAG: oligosaccharide flippase family protein, partial [Deltaproteobacteria bacterium]|nr:oligosaccharide flippase family protein [Deltaproteobacteria bacterium]
ALAIIQLSFNLLKYFFQYLVIHKKYTFLKLNRANCRRSMLKQIYHYSIYSFIISIALKLLFYTDSVVIGSLLTVSKITFYAIPATLMQYMEKFIYAAISVLTPVISSYDAVGEGTKNRNIYILGSRYALTLSIPVLFVLYTNGTSFISLWMGPEYGQKCSTVLKILIIGYIFAFPQMIANGILKGTSRHKVFAYILIVEAIANLAISIILVRAYDIEGVAFGTTLPLIITNFILVPLYTCKTLGLRYGTYLWRSYATPSVLLVLLGSLYYVRPIETSSYTELIVYSACITFVVAVFSLTYIFDKAHRNWLLGNLKKFLLSPWA